MDKQAQPPKKRTTAYLQFYRFQFRNHRDEALSVPQAGSRFGEQWRNLTLNDQARWQKIADEFNQLWFGAKGTVH